MPVQRPPAKLDENSWASIVIMVWPSEAGWRSSVPALIEQYLRRWDLGLGDPYSGGSAASVARVTTAAGVGAVLKLSLPHREARDEAVALRWWGGYGAIKVLRDDPSNPFVLLLERCEPGTPLSLRTDLPADERLTIAGSLLTRLWDRGVPDAALERVDDVTAEWADLVEARMRAFEPPYDAGLVAHGVRLLRELPAGARRTVVVHGDFNPGNVLAAGRAPWLVIDPKPMVGDPGYDLCPLLMQVDDPFRHPHPESLLRDRVDLLADLTQEPPSRILAWCCARMVEAALWYASRSEVAVGVESLRHAAVIAELAS